MKRGKRMRIAPEFREERSFREQAEMHHKAFFIWAPDGILCPSELCIAEKIERR